ncbi:MAG: DUF3332 domain-containing protein [Bacteroidaceae bacterium]|jgi:hypothetical protein|nr:DUF3332 domain-containing protein [Bacteroidaceae bacterium]
MKKTFRLSVLLLCATMLFSSCIGSFRLTNKIKDWNEGLANKWVNELVFIAMHIVPVYQISQFVDMVVLNSIEFWTGKSAIANVGEKKIVKNSEGQNIEITAMENGYNLTDGISSMNIVFDEEAQVWSAEYNNQTTELIKLVDENNAQLFLMNGEVMDVTLDAEGINMSRLYMNNSFALNR